MTNTSQAHRAEPADMATDSIETELAELENWFASQQGGDPVAVHLALGRYSLLSREIWFRN